MHHHLIHLQQHPSDPGPQPPSSAPRSDFSAVFSSACLALFICSFSRFLCQRAEDFIILRRAPTPVRPPARTSVAAPLLQQVHARSLSLALRSSILLRVSTLLLRCAVTDCNCCWCDYVCPIAQGYSLSFLITNFHTEDMKVRFAREISGWADRPGG